MECMRSVGASSYALKQLLLSENRFYNKFKGKLDIYKETNPQIMLHYYKHKALADLCSELKSLQEYIEGDFAQNFI